MKTTKKITPEMKKRNKEGIEAAKSIITPVVSEQVADNIDFSQYDPDGSYTGTSAYEDVAPIQDVDDL